MEAGICWAVKLEKEFTGKKSLAQQKLEGLKRKIFAFKMLDSAIPRSEMPIFSKDHTPIGRVTSGSVLPTVGGAGGLALLSANLQIHQEIFVDVRGKLKQAQLVEKPLYHGHTKD